MVIVEVVVEVYAGDVVGGVVLLDARNADSDGPAAAEQPSDDAIMQIGRRHSSLPLPVT